MLTCSSWHLVKMPSLFCPASRNGWPLATLATGHVVTLLGRDIAPQFLAAGGRGANVLKYLILQGAILTNSVCAGAGECWHVLAGAGLSRGNFGEHQIGETYYLFLLFSIFFWPFFETDIILKNFLRSWWHFAPTPYKARPCSWQGTWLRWADRHYTQIKLIISPNSGFNPSQGLSQTKRRWNLFGLTNY